MATNLKPDSQPSTKVEKIKRVPAALTTRVADQLTKAVLSKKITKDELATLSAHVSKLEAFVDA